MSRISQTAQDRMRAAIYVAAQDRVDNCGGCVYSDRAERGSDYWCRRNSGPTTKGACCAFQEPREARKWVKIKEVAA